MFAPTSTVEHLGEHQSTTGQTTFTTTPMLGKRHRKSYQHEDQFSPTFAINAFKKRFSKLNRYASTANPSMEDSAYRRSRKRMKTTLNPEGIGHEQAKPLSLSRDNMVVSDHDSDLHESLSPTREDRKFNRSTSKRSNKTHRRSDKTTRVRSCGCRVAGCMRCFPDEYHAIDCGRRHCRVCPKLYPGYDVWNVSQTRDDERLFTKGSARLTRTYNGKRNVMTMVVSERLMTVMQHSVIEGRKYRAIKNNIVAELTEIEKKARPLRAEYNDAIYDLDVIQRRLAKGIYKTSPEEKERLLSTRKNFKRAKHACRAFETRQSILKIRLKKAEQVWLASLRDVEYEHGLILEDAVVLSRDEEPRWVESDYKYPEAICSRLYDEGDKYTVGETSTASSKVSSNADNPNTRSTVEGEAIHVRKEWTKYLQIHTEAAERARKECEDTRNNFELFFDLYKAARPGRNVEELEEEYGPQYVQLGRECTQELRKKEVALERARSAAVEAGIDPNIEEGDEAIQEARIVREKIRKIMNVDRERIRRWIDVGLNAKPPTGGREWSWAESAVDSTSDKSGYTCTDRMEQRDSIHGDMTGSSAIASEKQAIRPRTRNGKTVKKRRDSRQRRVSDVFYGGISVFDDNEYRRRHIDAWAKKVREGYL